MADSSQDRLELNLGELRNSELDVGGTTRAAALGGVFRTFGFLTGPLSTFSSRLVLDSSSLVSGEASPSNVSRTSWAAYIEAVFIVQSFGEIKSTAFANESCRRYQSH